ncbi:MAG TPA: alpha/beta fold hydrolase, partial [Azonexus sp.]|nr:alpha/beta fold hydrolase [Azonexus sp.]
MNGIAVLLEELHRRNIELRIDGTRLLCSAPPGALGPELQALLRERKQDILDFLIAAQTLAARPPAIVPLQANGQRPPIFGAAGHNGDVFCYRTLVGHLDDNQPFFGLQPPGLSGSDPPLASIEELAAYFAAQIRAFQPGGPYVIAGYCAGGTIAFELARQLIAQEAEVPCTVLFGSPCPTWYGPLPQLRLQAIEQSTRLVRHARALLTLPWPELRAYIDDARQRREARRSEAEQRSTDPVMV